MNVLEPHFEAFQVFDSYACRTGKGTDAALRRALHYARRYPWVAKCDIRHYFDSIDHHVLQTLLSRRFKDHTVPRLLSAIIDTYETTPGRGVPIGNLTSQYFANHYLGFLDHYAKVRGGFSHWRTRSAPKLPALPANRSRPSFPGALIRFVQIPPTKQAPCLPCPQ